ncbi:hypothetical protein AMJ40_07540 [candidate division TA06 bacterium DG_26]|uniref:Roadblock/LAMTOR2 domain-containing protein n=1 Tax=candidate division TA06 bacterium DG_26 TaxID=1703771 RepID=A0A0S7WE32_UNCT6|nr:MAG: hypothetical protein AMJ40_07540 [candidate division TA06 bacterium DG_26]
MRETLIDFNDRLKRGVERVPGAVGGSLVGLDGIEIASYDTGEIDTAVMDAELASALSSALRSSNGMGAGRVQELILTSDGMTAVARTIGSEFFVCVLLRGDYSLGLARIEALRMGKEFEDSLI